MISIPHVAQVVRAVLTTTANRAARAPRWVPRRSKLSGAQFVQTVGFGWVANPDARDEELAQTAATLGVKLTAQGLERQRRAGRGPECGAPWRQAVGSTNARKYPVRFNGYSLVKKL